jgi:hypothetical protein
MEINGKKMDTEKLIKDFLGPDHLQELETFLAENLPEGCKNVTQFWKMLRNMPDLPEISVTYNLDEEAEIVAGSVEWRHKGLDEPFKALEEVWNQPAPEDALLVQSGKVPPDTDREVLGLLKHKLGFAIYVVRYVEFGWQFNNAVGAWRFFENPDAILSWIELPDHWRKMIEGDEE